MIKKVLFVGALAVSFIACKDTTAASSRIDKENAVKVEEASVPNQYPVVEFDKTEHDFGFVENNEAVYTEFELTNTGNADLIIINAFASCGCTVPEYQKTPIKPGETSKLKVRFQQATPGVQQKSVTLRTNTKVGEELLTIKANVGQRKN